MKNRGYAKFNYKKEEKMKNKRRIRKKISKLIYIILLKQVFCIYFIVSSYFCFPYFSNILLMKRKDVCVL